MRTIKASEVVKGMTVQVMTDAKGVERVIRGEVREVDTVTESTWITFVDNRSEEMHANHPVTVLAEPEPEWVEGAWYRCQVGTNEPENLRRLPHGWTPFHDTERVFHEDDEDITVLGRVLIVDWPGDDVARYIERNYRDDYEYIDEGNLVAQKVADAIRTQGGVR